MQFGPYKVLSDNAVIGNSYNANFRLQTDDITNPAVIAIINVFNADKGINYVLPVHGTDFSSIGTYQDFSIQFALADKDMMEFRMYVTGEGNVKSDKVFLSE